MNELIQNLIQRNKELKAEISKTNIELSRLNGAARDDLKEKLDEAYRNGLDDAWEAAKKISLMSPDEIEKVFPGAAKYNRYNLGYSGTEAIERLKFYEEKRKAEDEIKVGDEVISLRTNGEAIEDMSPWIVTYETRHAYQGFDAEGRFHNNPKDCARKTGRHFDFESLMEEMKA